MIGIYCYKGIMETIKLLETGESHRKRKAFGAAVGCFIQALEREPENLLALRGLADSYRGQKDFPRCIAIWRRYLELKPRDVSAIVRLGDAHKKMGDREEAIRCYTQALEMNATNRYALMGLGDLYYREQNLSKALDYWEPLIELDSTLVNIQTMVGNIHRKQLRFERARACFEAALQNAPSNPYAIFGMADTLRGLGEFEQAAPYWRIMLKLDPDNHQVMTRAGDCFLRLSLLSEAEELFKQALAIHFEKPAMLGLARTYRQMGAHEEAIQCYRSILDKNPDDIRTTLQLADTLADASGPQAAKDFLLEEKARHPELRELENALIRLG